MAGRDRKKIVQTCAVLCGVKGQTFERSDDDAWRVPEKLPQKALEAKPRPPHEEWSMYDADYSIVVIFNRYITVNSLFSCIFYSGSSKYSETMMTKVALRI